PYARHAHGYCLVTPHTIVQSQYDAVTNREHIARRGPPYSTEVVWLAFFAIEYPGGSIGTGRYIDALLRSDGTAVGAGRKHQQRSYPGTELHGKNGRHRTRTCD